MKVKRLVCFVMAFAMIFGMMSAAIGAVTAIDYSKNNCPISFVTTGTVGLNAAKEYSGISDNCSSCYYTDYTGPSISYHYSRVCEATSPNNNLGPYTVVHAGNATLVGFYSEHQSQTTMKLRIYNAYWVENSTTSTKMYTEGSMTAVRYYDPN